MILSFTRWSQRVNSPQHSISKICGYLLPPLDHNEVKCYLHFTYSNSTICTWQERKKMERGKIFPNFKLFRQFSPIAHSMSQYSGINTRWEMWIVLSVGLASNGLLEVQTFCSAKYNSGTLECIFLYKIFLKHRPITVLYLLFS